MGTIGPVMNINGFYLIGCCENKVNVRNSFKTK